MDDETEVIKRQMAETRESLAEKVEALENKVMSTVQGATDTVSSTVESVSDTVASVRETVQGTVQSVKGGVRDAAESVRGALDIRHHAQEHPWAVFCGSVAVGVIGGYLLTPRRRDPRDKRWPDMTGHTAMLPGPWPSFGRGDGLPPPQAGTRPVEPREEGPDQIDQVGDRFQPALSHLKELAIGAAVSMIGKMLVQSAPPALRDELSGVVEQFTTALGGKPMPPDADWSMPSAPSPPSRSQPSGESQPKPHNRLSGTKRGGNGRSGGS
jgi:ElaB/YqjD/DUF883 family membrane-anchored ribosome-binding protein